MQWLALQAKLPEHGVKRALITAMTKKHIFNIKWRGIKLLGNCPHLGAGYKKKLSIRINKPPDQPTTSDTINLRSYSCHPNIGASPFCAKNKAYAQRQASHFLDGRSAPDFAAEDYEVDFKGRATVDDLTQLGKVQMALAD